jgi:hypothetical protein
LPLNSLPKATESGQAPGWENHLCKVQENWKCSLLQTSDISRVGGLAAWREALSWGSGGKPLCLKPLSLGTEGEDVWAVPPPTGLQIRKHRSLAGMLQFSRVLQYHLGRTWMELKLQQPKTVRTEISLLCSQAHGTHSYLHPVSPVLCQKWCVKHGQQARASRMIKLYIIIKEKPVLIFVFVLLTSGQHTC